MGTLHDPMIPTKVFHEHLHGANRFFIEKLKGDRFRGFGLGIAHEPGQIGQSQTVMFDAAVCAMKALMKVDQLFCHHLNIVGVEVQIGGQFWMPSAML